MKNYKLEIAYDGTRYYGWERQPDRDTIQGKLEAVLSRMCEQPVEIIGAGRHEELLQSCPTYREISDSQMGGAFLD